MFMMLMLEHLKKTLNLVLPVFNTSFRTEQHLMKIITDMCLYSRYTSHLLTRAGHVTAVDFMDSFVEKNRQDNGHHSNATFIQADVTKLDVPRDRCVFRDHFIS